jgi:hypothetical protein
MAKIIPWIVTIGFLAGGVVSLLFPRRIQKMALRSDPRRPPLLKWYPSEKYVAREGYLWELRLIGFMSVGVGLYCIWVLCGGGI